MIPGSIGDGRSLRAASSGAWSGRRTDSNGPPSHSPRVARKEGVKRFSFPVALLAMALVSCADPTREDPTVIAPPPPTTQDSAGREPAPSATSISDTASATPSVTTAPPAAVSARAAETPLTIAELASASPKPEAEVEIRAFYVSYDAARLQTWGGATPPDTWMLTLADTPSTSDKVRAFCSRTGQPAAKVGERITVRGKLHQGMILNPCTLVAHEPGLAR